MNIPNSALPAKQHLGLNSTNTFLVLVLFVFALINFSNLILDKIILSTLWFMFRGRENEKVPISGIHNILKLHVPYFGCALLPQ